MLSDVIGLIDFVERRLDDAATLRALFRADGERVSGDESLDVSVHRANQRTWFYSVQGPEGYEFVYLPVIPSVNVDYGTRGGDPVPDAKVFRFVASPMARFAAKGEPNVQTDFIVVGYRPKDLLKARAASA